MQVDSVQMPAIEKVPRKGKGIPGDSALSLSLAGLSEGIQKHRQSQLQLPAAFLDKFQLNWLP